MSPASPAPASRPRRDILAGSTRALAGVWLTATLPWATLLAGRAREDARRGAPFRMLTPAEGAALRAFATRIFPSDERPGAEEAGAAWFVDRALGTPQMGDDLPVVRAGLDDLHRRARLRGAAGFHTLDDAGQLAIMREIERDEFFRRTRTLVLLGVFADPVHRGGGRDRYEV